FEGFTLGFLAELNDPAGVVDLDQPEFGSFVGARGCQRNRHIGPGLNVPHDEVTIIHSVKMIARQHENSVALVVIQMMQALAHGISGTLKPIGPLWSDLSRENLDKAVCE